MKIPVDAQAIEDPFKNNIFESRSFSNLVVSITADEEDLYSEERGILSTQYMTRGMDGEREISLFVYNADGTPLIAQEAGIRVSGTASRTAIRKSFRVIARKDYDSRHPRFTYDLWGGRRTLDGTDQPVKEYSSFLLHAVRLAADSTGINNSVSYSLAKKAGIADASPTTPAALYINGAYQGSYFLMQSKTDNAICELYNIPSTDDIELVSVFAEQKGGVQDHPEVLEEYLAFVSFVQNSDVNDPEVAASIERQLDVEQCLQYHAVNLLLANGDWGDNNLRVWRCKDHGLPYQDGRWRFVLFDLDWAGSFPDSIPMAFQQLSQTNDNYSLLHSLLRNPKWLALFKKTITQMKADAFNTETILSVIQEEDARMIGELTYDFQSEAFPGYLVYSVNSAPLTEEDYLTLDDRALLLEDFTSHLLKAPDMVDACLDAYYPE